MDRRSFLRASALTGAALAGGFGPDFWRQAFAVPAVTDIGPYGALLPADVNGFQLPPGFTSRVVARSSQQPIASSPYVWHSAPDGGATFAAPDGGWVYVSNSESGLPNGGVGALRFDSSGNVVDAYSILRGTGGNCAGGATPWGTWLSCEERTNPNGSVWECDPFVPKAAADPTQQRAALGQYNHEAVAVDPIGQKLYLTEDSSSGRLYRFTPGSYPNLSTGSVQAAFRNVTTPATTTQGEKGTLTWVPVATITTGYRGTDSSAFNGGEGIWYDEGWVYFATKGDNKIWALELATQNYEVIYDRTITPNPVGGPANSGILSGVDNVFVSPFSGDIYVAEDGGDMDLVLLAAPGVPTDPRIACRFFKLTGFGTASEITGPAMSPDGSRMYVSAQRGPTGSSAGGITYEISGPFRNTRSPGPVVPEFPLAAAAVGTAAAVAGAAIAFRTRQGRQEAVLP